MTYVIIPIAQTSIAAEATIVVYIIISGVIYFRVAAVFLSAEQLVTRPAMPKSTTFILVQRSF